MKISTNSAAAVLLTGAFLATSCANDVETSVNTDPQGNAISFTASVGRSSRATEISLTNLGDFAVVAKGIHPDGVLYNSYLIGDDNSGEIARFKSLTSDKTSGTWTLDRSVYWPSSLNRVLFIGYTTLKRGTDDKSETDDVLNGAIFSATGGTPKISGFKPYKPASLTANDKDNNDEIWADGEGQKDLLVAFTDMERGSNTTVKLQFRHALTQLSVKASQKDLDANDDHRIVKVKGAWIVNAAESGDLSATIESKKVGENTITVTNKTTWTAKGTATYGTYYDGIRELNGTTTTDILSKSLMLIPQSLTKWNNTSNTTGAYIMLLCRIELKHSGATHTGSDITDIAIEGNNHYHQLFPVNATYDGSQYGFVCVPIDTDWGADVTDAEDCKGAGKHYTYNLDICGKNSGAGIYPPTPEKDKLIPSGATVEALVLVGNTYEKQNKPLNVVDRPSGKNVGDNVLDDPIKFNVTVSDWAEENKTWEDGNKSTASED